MNSEIIIFDRFELADGITVLACNYNDSEIEVNGKNFHLRRGNEIRQCVTVAGQRQLFNQQLNDTHKALEINSPIKLTTEEAQSGEWRLTELVSIAKQKLLNLKEMEPIAQKATFEALQAYMKPTKSLVKITLGKVITDDEGIFELYIPAEKPQDAKVISCAKVNRITGEVKVDVFLTKL